MKTMKGLISCITAGICLIIIGGIGFAAVLAYVDWNFTALDLEKFTPHTTAFAYEDGAAIKKLDIEVREGRVEIVFSGEYNVQSEESDAVKIEAFIEGETLKIRQTVDYNWKFTIQHWFTITRNNIVTKITLPADEYDLKAVLHNGRLNISDNDSAKTLGAVELEFHNGKAELSNLTAKSLTVKTHNGTTKLSDVTVDENAVLTSSNGKIELKNTNICGDLTLSAKNGSITVNSVFAQGTATINSENGTVNFSNLVAQKVKATVSNGKILFTALDCGDIYLYTKNGKIEGTIEGNSKDYTIFIESHNGKVSPSYDRGNGAKTLTAITNNGRIEIHFSHNSEKMH